jgi:hypothetical protein
MTEVLAFKTRGIGLDSSTAGYAIVQPSGGSSVEASAMEASLAAIQGSLNVPLGYRRTPAPLPHQPRSTEERLFDSLSRVKVLTAQVAMHLQREWRDRLFRQLDNLLKPEDWHEADEPIQEESFSTFLRTIIHLHPGRRPGLGLSDRGYLIAAWTAGADKLTLEFLPRDGIRWILTCNVDGEKERAAGETFVARLPQVLASYHPSRWFENGNPASSS